MMLDYGNIVAWDDFAEKRQKAQSIPFIGLWTNAHSSSKDIYQKGKSVKMPRPTRSEIGSRRFSFGNICPPSAATSTTCADVRIVANSRKPAKNSYQFKVEFFFEAFFTIS
ncbi:MAG: hypothetical protein AAF639_11195 [Chloroflexota bacterium]